MTLVEIETLYICSAALVSGFLTWRLTGTEAPPAADVPTARAG
jgi:hypothetical protein